LGDDSGFDYFSFKAEISRLALPSQDVSVEAHVIYAHDEPDFSMALRMCKRQSTLAVQQKTYAYLNTRCILAHVERYDDLDEFTKNSKTKLQQQQEHLFTLRVVSFDLND